MPGIASLLAVLARSVKTGRDYTRPHGRDRATWAPSSWRVAARAAAARLARPRRGRRRCASGCAQLPPLVFAGEARALLRALGEAAEGRAFLLQAGDCAESFREVSAVAIRERLKVLLQMSAVLTYGATLPVVKVGRIAGQFAKPRTAPTERVDGVELPVVPRARDPLRRADARGARRPTRSGWCRPTTRRSRRSTCCARSRRAASPT